MLRDKLVSFSGQIYTSRSSGMYGRTYIPVLFHKWVHTCSKVAASKSIRRSVGRLTVSALLKWKQLRYRYNLLLPTDTFIGNLRR